MVTATADTKKRLREAIVAALSLKIEPEQIPETGLREELDLDSLAGLELLIWVEDAFDISIDDADLNITLIDSLDSLGSYIEERLTAAVPTPDSAIST